MFGYVDGPRLLDAPTITATRLNQLQRHIDAWNRLDWVESRIDIEIDIPTFRVVREGVCALANDSEVVCIQFPSVARGIPLRTWKLGNFGFPISDIEISPSNNLLVIESRLVCFAHTYKPILPLCNPISNL